MRGGTHPGSKTGGGKSEARRHPLKWRLSFAAVQGQASLLPDRLQPLGEGVREVYSPGESPGGKRGLRPVKKCRRL